MKEFHPVADLFPLLRGAQFAELAADIGKNALREPILVDGDGRILDGRNRYRACLVAGAEPRFVEWKGARLAKMMETEAVKRKGRRTDLAADLQQGRRCRSSGEAAIEALKARGFEQAL